MEYILALVAAIAGFLAAWFVLSRKLTALNDKFHLTEKQLAETEQLQKRLTAEFENIANKVMKER